MYKDIETATSYDYLRTVIKHLNEPVCILGGWAVFFHVNRGFIERQGKPYIGSRDIDLGFQVKDRNTLKEAIRILTEEIGFKPQSFRYYKEIHTETGKEVDGKNIPSHFLFPMYVDVIVDTVPTDFRNLFGFNPIDEPMLKHVFAKHRLIIREFDRRLLLPTAEVLLSMKLKSCPERDKSHKRIKDLCDIFALAWYTDINPENVDLSPFITTRMIKRCISALHEEDYRLAAQQLGHDPREIKRVVQALLH